MSEEKQINNNTPPPSVAIPLPDGEVALLERRKQLAPFLLDPAENYPEPFYMLEYNGVPFSTLGGIQALSGQKKNGKTFLITQLMAAILGVDSNRCSKYLQGLTVPERTLEHLRHLPTVLYIDTEMEKLNTAKVLRRVHWLCGWQMDRPCERFHVMSLRSIVDVKDAKGEVTKRAHKRRYELVREAIEVFKPDAVFIDGIRDLIGDFNDNSDASSLVADLSALADERNICIWNVLHQNPRVKAEDASKMRGHLGTELGNKVTDTMVCVKHKQDGKVWFSVYQDDARGKDMDDWEFEVTEDAGALGIPKIKLSLTAQDIEEAGYQRERQEADDYLKQYPWTSTGASYTAIDKWLYGKGLTSGRRRSDIIRIAKESGIIYMSEKKKYYYAGLKGTIPNDTTDPLPFAPTQSGKETPF